MIKRSHVFVSGFFVAAAICFAASPGCSSTPPATSGPTYTSTLPPTRPTTTGTGTDSWFAVSKLQLGITKRVGGASSKAWQDYGFDLDGRNTSADQSAAAGTAAGALGANTCMRLAGSSSNYLVDGPGGLDNNFGQFLVQTIKSLKSDAEDSVNTSITDGKFTLLLHLQNFSTTDHDKVTGEIYVGNNTSEGTAPKFSTADHWKVNSASLTGSGYKDGDPFAPGKSLLVFGNGYISAGQWVSGDFGAGNIDLEIGISGTTISLPISSGVITVGVDGKNGTIAGAINIGDFTGKLGPLAARFGICPDSPNYKTVVDSLTRSADVVTGKPQLQDPGNPCTGISIGLGFVMTPTGVPTNIYVSPPPDGGGSCDDTGGSDGGGATDAAAGG